VHSNATVTSVTAIAPTTHPMSEVWVMTRFLFVSPRLTALHYKYGAATHWYVRWITSRKSWGFCYLPQLGREDAAR
jgi:hypothetical protein